MNFSFVLPSRGEKDPVLKMLDSFERTTNNKKGIEFLIAIDEGNTKIVDIVNKRNYGFNIQFFERPQTDDFTNDYYNWLADRSVGRNVVAFNDDAWMRTNDWDYKILKTVGQYNRNIYMLDLIDTARIKYGNRFPCFPCISRRAFATMGWLLHPKIPIYPADKVTHDVYRRCDRVIPIMDVLIEHEHKPETDESKMRMFNLFKNNNTLKKDENGVPQIDIGDDIVKLSKIASSDGPLRLNKLTRILNILKEK